MKKYSYNTYMKTLNYRYKNDMKMNLVKMKKATRYFIRNYE